VKPFLKLALALVATWALCCAAALVVLGAGAALTERWSAARVGPVVAGLLAADALLFAAGLPVAWLAAKRCCADSAARLAIAAGFAVVQAASFALMCFVTLVAFNR
jgi:hypothetical protein